MRIFWGEVRRYLRPLTLAVVGLLMMFWVILYHSGFERPSYRHWGLLSVEYQQRFGDTIDREELELIKQELNDLHAELDGLIETYMGEYDIHSFEDYWLLTQLDSYRATDEEKVRAAEERWGAEHLDELANTCWSIYWHGSMEELAWREQEIRSIIENFDLLYDNKAYIEAVKTNDPEWGFHLSDYQKQRILADLQGDEMSLVTFGHTGFRNYFEYYMVLIYVLCAVIAVPFLVTNRVTDVQTLQFSAKIGKGILNKQLGAALLLAAAVNLIVDTFFYLAFFYNEDEKHYLLNCPLNVGAGRNQLWLDLTYRQYVFLLFAQALLLSLALTCGLFAASYRCKNYITAAAIAVPSVIAVSLLSQNAPTHMYLDPNAAWEYPVMVVLPIVVVIAATLIFYCNVWRRRDNRE